MSEKLIITEISGYRDGGTISIKTNLGEYCIDGRAMSDEDDNDIKNPTEGMLYFEHPSKGKKSWNTGTKGLTTSWNKGLKLPPMPEEYRDKISKGLKKKYETEEHHSKGKKPWNAGKKGVQIPWNAGIKMPKVKCPHCEKECDKLNASKWHFDKCKFKVQK